MDLGRLGGAARVTHFGHGASVSEAVWWAPGVPRVRVRTYVSSQLLRSHGH